MKKKSTLLGIERTTLLKFKTFLLYLDFFCFFKCKNGETKFIYICFIKNFSLKSQEPRRNIVKEHLKNCQSENCSLAKSNSMHEQTHEYLYNRVGGRQFFGPFRDFFQEMGDEFG